MCEKLRVWLGLGLEKGVWVGLGGTVLFCLWTWKCQWKAISATLHRTTSSSTSPTAMHSFLSLNNRLSLYTILFHPFHWLIDWVNGLGWVGLGWIRGGLWFMNNDDNDNNNNKIWRGLVGAGEGEKGHSGPCIQDSGSGIWRPGDVTPLRVPFNAAQVPNRGRLFGHLQHHVLDSHSHRRRQVRQHCHQSRWPRWRYTVTHCTVTFPQIHPIWSLPLH